MPCMLRPYVVRIRGGTLAEPYLPYLYVIAAIYQFLFIRVSGSFIFVLLLSSVHRLIKRYGALFDCRLFRSIHIEVWLLL